MLSLRALFSSCFALGMLMVSFPSFAVDCTATGGSRRFTESIGSSIAVPINAPVGTIVWQSARTANISCVPYPGYNSNEYLFFYVDPAIARATLNGVEFGIEYNGVQYWGGVRIQSDLIFYPARGTMTYVVPYKVLLRTKAGFTAGPVSSSDNFDVFMIDGAEGLNPASTNYRYAVSGLSKIRFVNCGATASVTPSSIHFGQIPLSRVTSSASNLAERRFVINLNKVCDAAFSVTSTFTSNNGYADSQATIMKAFNSSDNQTDSGLGISIYLNGASSPVAYGASTKMGAMSASDRTIQVPVVARLLATNPSIVTPGGFRGLLVFTLYLQ